MGAAMTPATSAITGAPATLNNPERSQGRP
jgi:hypothetical protein